MIELLGKIDRRIVYLFIAMALALPLIVDFSLPPAQMRTADDLFAAVDSLERQEGKIALVSFDWGPSTQAENRAQTAVIIEHLLRKRVPFAVISTYAYASPFLASVPQQIAEELTKEQPGERWSYGQDWVNLGYRPGSAIMIQGLAKAEDLKAFLKTDARGTPLNDIPCFQRIRTVKDVQMLLQFTGLVGAFGSWLQFFQTEDYRPPMVHGCTSITIPEAYIFYVSKQILGLFEGVAGAAWYDHLLSQRYPKRSVGVALRTNTSLAVAHLLIISLIILGNISLLFKRSGEG